MIVLEVIAVLVLLIALAVWGLILWARWTTRGDGAP